MRGRWLEDLIDGAAAAVLAASSAFALATLAPQAGVAAVFLSLPLFAACWAVLKRVPAEHRLPLAAFEAIQFDCSDELEELILSADQIIAPAHGVVTEDELILDDVLSALGPDSRVVRLFTPQLPTPGELKSTIDRHLQDRSSPPPIPDASRALSDALAELRQSLR